MYFSSFSGFHVWKTDPDPILYRILLKETLKLIFPNNVGIKINEKSINQRNHNIEKFQEYG